MSYSKYEIHPGYDAEFPLKFHLDKKTNEKPGHDHWHEHVEILYIKTGVCTVNAGDVISILYPGETILFSPDCSHEISGSCSYYCITVDRSFCIHFGIPANRGQFSQVVREGAPCACFARIVSLMEKKPFCYRAEVKALCMQMLSIIYRMHDTDDRHISTNNKMIADAIEYLNIHFADPLTIDEVCEHVGFSKYYFCRKFKAVTGKTVVDYINFLRCVNARRLIQSGQHNVSESAYMSGFNNLSYFSRTYIKHMGHSPSEEKQYDMHPKS